jgi:hypothetical protein
VRFKVYIAISALFASLALVGVGAPVAAQASTPTITTLNGYPVYCYGPGEQFTVQTTGVHIKSTPNGSNVYSISKGALFDSNWRETNCGGLSGWYLLVTVNQYGGQYWVEGWNNAAGSQRGWVGSAYLLFKKYCNSKGC